ncbi:MAG: tRNA (adenosine(37)-N6)-dimethylallyltransferase MiaA, partial [Rhodospirillaceae bacterium]|nr:tRNA (adenosine(37)-N6)-dimethylallyltransferase MiaA [Rhodospirillaceae bacterium]
HLIDIADPAETYSAGKFAADARAAMASIFRRDRIPLLVGGTLFYLRSLRDGLAELPAADPEVRRRLDEEAEAVGWAALYERLRRIDPDAAQTIAPTDRQRIQRALEVVELTGESLTALRAQRQSQRATPVQALALLPGDRNALARRIERRFDDMLAAGLTDEVRALRERGDLAPTTPAMRAVGYRQIWAFLDGAYEWHEARRRAIVATRQLAKRQLTWLRSETRIQCLPAQQAAAADVLRKALRAFAS